MKINLSLPPLQEDMRTACMLMAAACFAVSLAIVLVFNLSALVSVIKVTFLLVSAFCCLLAGAFFLDMLGKPWVEKKPDEKDERKPRTSNQWTNL